MKNTFKTVKYCYFFFHSQLTRLIQNEQNATISKHCTNSAEYTRTTSGTIFSAVVWISGGQVIFFITNLVHTFRSFHNTQICFISDQSRSKWFMILRKSWGTFYCYNLSVHFIFRRNISLLTDSVALINNLVSFSLE